MKIIKLLLIIFLSIGFSQLKSDENLEDLENKILKNGDILNIDVTVIKDGWHGDTSKMFLVGKCQPHNERLVKVTQECLYKAIKLVKPGAYLGDIGHIIQKHAESNYYSVVEDYCGHGIGTVYHGATSFTLWYPQYWGSAQRGHVLHYRAYD